MRVTPRVTFATNGPATTIVAQLDGSGTVFTCRMNEQDLKYDRNWNGTQLIV